MMAARELGHRNSRNDSHIYLRGDFGIHCLCRHQLELEVHRHHNWYSQS
jgi:hypothetical protein